MTGDRSCDVPEADAGELAAAVVAWVRDAPSARAVIDGEAVLSRGDLLRWAAATGDVLRALADPTGPSPELCALVLPRSWAVPLGLIAARMAGLAFVLLDEAEAPPRLVAALRTARPRLVVTTQAGSDPIAALCGSAGLSATGDFVVLTPPYPTLELLAVRRCGDARRLPPGTGHLVFTSGSGGRPKAVVLRDGPLLRTAAAQRALLGTDGSGTDAHAPSVWALSPGFDASLSDVFCAILGSAPLLVCRGGQTRWRSLAALIARHGAARADLSPSLLRLLPPHALGLRAVIFGGERCDPDAAVRWGRMTLALQAYGPTEAAVCATVARAGPAWRPGLLGRPLDHQIVLLATQAGVFRVVPRHDTTPDDEVRFNATSLVSLGDGPEPPDGEVQGEIWLAGDAVAIGYLDAPEEEEAARFGLHQGVRVHRTGDVARWSDGLLAWLGRADRQFKLHGRRVVPEEIEAVAARVWGAACACVAIDGRLVLAMAARDDPAIAAEEALTAIARALGPALRPRGAVTLAPWPTLANGKTDLSAVTVEARRLAGSGT
ncbi:MAG: AMP-binding protein [Janthinobacterium lividum]